MRNGPLVLILRRYFYTGENEIEIIKNVKKTNRIKFKKKKKSRGKEENTTCFSPVFEGQERK